MHLNHESYYGYQIILPYYMCSVMRRPRQLYFLIYFKVTKTDRALSRTRYSRACCTYKFVYSAILMNVCASFFKLNFSIIQKVE